MRRSNNLNKIAYTVESKTLSGIQQRAPLGLLTIVRLVNSIAKSIIALVQNTRCSFYITAGLEDFEDKVLSQNPKY